MLPKHPTPEPLSLLHPDNPERPVDWRWMRATVLVEKQTLTGRFGDPLVASLVRYLSLKRGGAKHEELIKAHRLLFSMDQLFEVHETTRWMLEGLLVANEPDADIADYLGLLPEVVKLYHDCLFEVRSRLPHPGFVFGRLLDTAASGEFNQTNLDKWYKILGYHGFRAGLSALLLKCCWDFNALPEAIRQWYRNMVDDKLLKTTALCVSSRMLDRHTATYLLDSYFNSRKLEVDIQSKGLGDGSADDKEKTKEMLSSFTMSVATITKTDSPAIEPRAAARLLEELTKAGICTLPAPETSPDGTNG